METVEYISLRPATVETPTAEYRKYWFFYEDGVAQIFTHGRTLLLSASGVLEHTADQEWTFTTDTGDVWDIERGGCNCGGSGVIQKTTSGP